MIAITDRRTTRILFTIFVYACVLAVAYLARRVLLIFVLAILFAYLMDPVIRFLQLHSFFFRNLRGPHVLEAYVVFLLLFLAVGHVLAPGLVGVNSRLLRTLPVVAEDLSTGAIAKEVGARYGWSEGEELRWQAFLVSHRETVRSFVDSLERSAPRALAMLLVAPILSIFFLSDGKQIAEAVIRLVSTNENREAAREVADELNRMLRLYIRAKVILVGCSFVFYSTAMLALRFPRAIALGVLGGILEFIPMAGWMISAAAILTVGSLTHAHWIWMAALLGVWRLAMDYFISPRIVGQNLEIHPLLVILVVMTGGEIGGIVGIYLSIPFVVVVRVLWNRLVSLPGRGVIAPELQRASES